MAAQKPNFGPFQLKEGETLYEYWLSFSPMAPFFGVEWRFAPMMGMKGDFAKAAEEALIESSRTMAKATEAAQAQFTETTEKAIKTSTNAAKVMEKAKSAAIEAGELATDIATKSAEKASASAKKVAEQTAESLTNAAEKATEISTKAATQAVESVAEASDAVMAPAKLYKSAPKTASDLKLIRGVGPKLEKELNQMGIYTFDQISKFTEANLAWVDQNLSAFKGRPLRDNWVEQAMNLMK